MMDTTTQSLICCSILDGMLSPERLSRGSSSEIVCFAYNFCEEMARMMEEMIMITVSLTSSPCKPWRMPRKRSSNNASYSISLSSSDTFFGTSKRIFALIDAKFFCSFAIFFFFFFFAAGSCYCLFGKCCLSSKKLSTGLLVVRVLILSFIHH